MSRPSLRRNAAFLLCMAAGCLLGTSSSTAGAWGGWTARRVDMPEGQALVRALNDANQCRLIWLWLGSDIPCSHADPPEQYRDLYDALLGLAWGEAHAAVAPQSDESMRRQTVCQIAIAYSIANVVKTSMRDQARAAGGRRFGRFPAAGRLRPVLRLCRVEVRRGSGGVDLPRVGSQCHAAVGDQGSEVDAEALARCLQTMVETWVQRANPGRAVRRPNIVVILTDDQRFDSVDRTHSPDDVPIMPAVMDRLAGAGVVFENAYVSNSVCAPSRATAMTGRYTSGHGLLQNGQHFDESSTIATWLQDRGYRTGFVGKYVNDYPSERGGAEEPPLVPAGWSDWRAFSVPDSIPYYGFEMIENGEATQYGHGEGDYATDVLARHAVDFIEQTARDDSPFLLFVATSAPHYPWLPAARHRGLLAASPHFRPASYFETDVSDKPSWVRNLAPLTLIGHLGTQSRRRAQLEMLQAVDELASDVLDTLDDLGLADNTVVIYTSDNGEGWGEHRWGSKACPWEECLRVPLIIRAPWLTPLARTESRMAVNIDLAPTIAHLAGAPIPDFVDGESLVTALDDTAKTWRSDFLIESFSGDVRTYHGIHTGDEVLVEYLNGELEFYDLANDPDQLESLAFELGALGRMIALLGRESALRREHGFWP